MPAITRFEENEAWQTARELTKLIYLNLPTFKPVALKLKTP